MKHAYKRLLVVTILAACISLIGTGCKTAEGFGKDVEDLGENIQGD